jgi:hypothetical protein
MKNRLVYKREGQTLGYIGMVMSKDAADAAERAVGRPGKYVVFDLDYTEVAQVYVGLTAEQVLP